MGNMKNLLTWREGQLEIFFYNLKVAARMCKQFFLYIFPHIIVE